MSTPILSHPGESRHLLQGWLSSVLFHVVAAAAALALVSGLRMPPQPDAFKWNVALVEPPRPQPAVERPPQPKPPTPKVTPTVEPIQPRPAMQTVQQRVVQTVQAVQRMVQRETVQTVQATTPVTAVNQTASVVTQAVQQSEPSHFTAPTAIATATSVAREAVAHEEPLAAPSSTAIQHTASQVATATAVQQASAQIATATAVQQTAAPVATEPVVAQSKPTSVHERPAAEPVTESTVAQVSPARSIPAAKADYGWLAASIGELLRNGIKNRYPYLARMNRLEGQVVLTVMVKADGSLSDIKVKASSGHAILDRDAEAFLASLSPLRLKYPLGKASQMIEVPISYSLRG